MANDAALIEEAGNLYVREGRSLEHVAGETGVPPGTIRRWSVQYDWKRRRSRYLQQSNDLDAYVEKIKLRLAEELLQDAFDPQRIYGLARGLAVLKPSAQLEMKKVDQAEKEASSLSPEEQRAVIREAIEADYGISRQ